MAKTGSFALIPIVSFIYRIYIQLGSWLPNQRLHFQALLQLGVTYDLGPANGMGTDRILATTSCVLKEREVYLLHLHLYPVAWDVLMVVAILGQASQ